MSNDKPVVFVHGNYGHTSMWAPIGYHLMQRGYTDADLYEIDFDQWSPSHDEMAAQLDTYIRMVLRETDAEEVDIVSHSLGVTGVRWWMHHGGHQHVDTFIGIGGANHGMKPATWACMFGLDFGPFGVSQNLRADYYRIENHPLRVMNRDETPYDVDYYTIRGRFDEMFMFDPYSPELDGATNVALNTNHMGLLNSDETFRLIEEWLI